MTFVMILLLILTFNDGSTGAFAEPFDGTYQECMEHAKEHADALAAESNGTLAVATRWCLPIEDRGGDYMRSLQPQELPEGHPPVEAPKRIPGKDEA